MRSCGAGHRARDSERSPPRTGAVGPESFVPVPGGPNRLRSGDHVVGGGRQTALCARGRKRTRGSRGGGSASGRSCPAAAVEMTGGGDTEAALEEVVEVAEAGEPGLVSGLGDGQPRVLEQK